MLANYRTSGAVVADPVVLRVIGRVGLATGFPLRSREFIVKLVTPEGNATV